VEGVRYQTLALSMVLVACGAPEPSNVGPETGFEEVAERLTAFIEHEMGAKGLPAVSIALVDDQETVWATGFGQERAGVPADATTIYRVGSVSKLFTDLAIMQLVERGELDLDAPITAYLPDFEVGPPLPAREAASGPPTGTDAASGPPSGTDAASGPPTLRQLMSHRAGIVREPPVGHYFDDTAPTLAETVGSLRGTPRIYPAGSKVKYSNAGIATAGYVLERTQETPFTDYVRQAVLAPLGMMASSFTPTPLVRERLAEAVMWSYDSREFPAPGFQLGMSPAGSMYAPVTDLARFMSAIFGAGANLGISAETLKEMLTDQFEEGSGFGIGFSLGSLDGHFYAGHGGAVYGFATQLAMLPDEKLGVVAVTTMDVANTVMNRVADYALRLMLARRDGEPLPDVLVTDSVPAKLASRAEAGYESLDGTLALTVVDRKPYGIWAEIGGQRYLLGSIGDTLVIDDRHGFGGFFHLEGEDLLARDGTRLTRISNWPGSRPEAPPPDLVEFVGEYGWDHNVLFIYEDAGQLKALIEWTEMDALTRLGPDEFAFPATGGLYHGERIVFERDAAGTITAAVAAGVRFQRRPGADDGETFTIDPVRPIAELRAEALAASPPDEQGDFLSPDLVEVSDVEPAIQYDIRYASSNNFMQSVFYQTSHAYLQRDAAEAVARAHRALAEHGFGLMVHDAYRPWFVTKMFWDATPEKQKRFVANPANGSRHNRGAAVDLTLVDLATGQPAHMTSGYDEFSERSYSDYVGGTSLKRWKRELLRSVMEAEGFQVYEYEWWHFDYKDWSRYPIMNETFEQIDSK
jgi:D-alanyl-D-alanine dipeptidase/CubicO group peptidase (beta-lactamase class C family)